MSFEAGKLRQIGENALLLFTAPLFGVVNVKLFQAPQRIKSQDDAIRLAQKLAITPTRKLPNGVSDLNLPGNQFTARVNVYERGRDTVGDLTVVPPASNEDAGFMNITTEGSTDQTFTPVRYTIDHNWGSDHPFNLLQSISQTGREEDAQTEALGVVWFEKGK